MRESQRAEIRALPLFRDMRAESFDRLLQAGYVQSFPPQLDLFEQGEAADFLHILIEGMVELYASWQARESTMTIVRPVGTFILAACIRDAPYLMSARTLEKSRLVMVPAPDLRAVFRSDPAFAMSTIDELAQCYRAVVRHSKTLKLRTARERLAAYVLRQSERDGGAASFVLPVEKRMLASYLGMTAENLSRAFKTLLDDGVKVDGNRIIITDRAALVARAAPDPLIDGPDASESGVVPLRRAATGRPES